ncbi:hypothetical protein ES703_27113 [subsurface metagenome]
MLSGPEARDRSMALFPKTIRDFVHIPVGMFIIALAAIGVSLGGGFLPALLTLCALFTFVFLVYELRQGSKAHIDIASFLWGIVFGVVPWVSLALAGVI